MSRRGYGVARALTVPAKAATDLVALILPPAVACARSKSGHSGEASRRVCERSRLVRVSHPALRPLSRLSTFIVTAQVETWNSATTTLYGKDGDLTGANRKETRSISRASAFRRVSIS